MPRRAKTPAPAPAPEPPPTPAADPEPKPDLDPMRQFFADCHAFARCWLDIQRREREQDAARRTLDEVTRRLRPPGADIGHRPCFLSLDVEGRTYVLMFRRVPTGAVRVTLHPAPHPPDLA